MPGLSSKRRALKVDVLQDRKLYCLQARPYIFQPGHFTGWSSEGVKGCVLALSERHSYALHRVPEKKHENQLSEGNAIHHCNYHQYKFDSQ